MHLFLAGLCICAFELWQFPFDLTGSWQQMA
jgi:hypothetical protein